MVSEEILQQTNKKAYMEKGKPTIDLVEFVKKSEILVDKRQKIYINLGQIAISICGIICCCCFIYVVLFPHKFDLESTRDLVICAYR